jgi:transposase
MDYITYAERLDYLLELINKGQAYSPKEIALKFSCTEKTIRNMINRLRENGEKISYCRKVAISV